MQRFGLILLLTLTTAGWNRAYSATDQSVSELCLGTSEKNSNFSQHSDPIYRKSMSGTIDTTWEALAAQESRVNLVRLTEGAKLRHPDAMNNQDLNAFILKVFETPDHQAHKATSAARFLFTLPIKELLKHTQVSVYKGVYYSLPTLMRDLGTNPDAVGAVSQVALDLLHAIHQAGKGREPVIKFDNIWETLVDAFRSHGFTQPNAESLALQTLGLYSVRGSSWSHLLDNVLPMRSYPLFAGLALISVEMTYLDTLAIKRLSSFSLPPKWVTSCHHSRPYHFWMSAYLTRYLVDLGKRANASRTAVLTLGEAYERFATPSTSFKKTIPKSIEQIETIKDGLAREYGSYWVIRPFPEVDLREPYERALRKYLH